MLVKMLTSVSVLLLLAAVCSCNRLGPPVVPYVCNALAPDPNVSPHRVGTPGDGGYMLDITPSLNETSNGFSFVGGTVYTITLSGSVVFQGFVVQARVPGDTPTLGASPQLLGAFTPAVAQRTRDCDGIMGTASEATITHADRQNANSVQFTWTAPATSGEVDFYFTVLQSFTVHFDAISAAQGAPTEPPMTTGPITTMESTAPMTTLPPTTAPPGNTVPPVRSPDDYRLTLTSPSNCTRANCDLYIGIDTNTGDSGFLDIYMEGRAEGWIAVGFSQTADMFSSDVVACNRVGDNIMVLDTWNPPRTARASPTDTIQDVALYSAAFDANNTRIYCTASKRIAPSGVNEDLNLNANLFVIFARRVSPTSNLGLTSHAVDGTAVRGAIPTLVNPAVGVGVIGGAINEFDVIHRPNLIRAHGILMIIAWPLLAVTGIFFALFMRPALPNGEWFKVHRALLLCSLFIGAAGFVLIFVALSTSGGLVDVSNNVSLTHLIFGVLIMALQIINPLIAICRCDPGEKNRWIFNLIHGSVVGLLAEILSLVNVALGLFIFFTNLGAPIFRNLAPLWLFVSWDAFYVILVITFFIVFTIKAVTSKKKGLAPSAIQGILPNEEEKSSKVEPAGINLDSAVSTLPTKSAPKRKPPSEDAPLRWVALAVYLGVTVPTLFAVIVMVAFPQ